MRGTLTIAGRELRSSFCTPGPYVIGALFLAAMGVVFWAGVFDAGRHATLRPVFQVATWILLFVGPALGMGALSDERKHGTIEMLLTGPVSEAEVILGKFLGAMVFLLVITMPLAVQAYALELHGRPDYGEMLCGWLGLMLAGMAYVATAVFTSTLAASQIIAFLSAFFFWLALGLAGKVLPPYLPEGLRRLVFASDPDPRLQDFAIGLLDSGNVAYFVVIAAAFLVGAIKVLESRRWR